MPIAGLSRADTPAFPVFRVRDAAGIVGFVVATSVSHEPVSARCAACRFRVPEICDRSLPERVGDIPTPCPGAAPSDHELIRRHEAEKSSGLPLTSFGLLFERHHKHVVSWACRIGGDLDLARDLAQEVFIKVFSRVAAFRAESRFTTWLYTVTRNCVRDHVKARSVRPVEVGGEALLESLAIPGNEVVARLEAEEARRLVRRLVRDARLDPVEQRVFVMHYRDEMSLTAIGATLGLANASGAKAPIVSATRKLRAAAARWSAGSRRLPAAASGSH